MRGARVLAAIAGVIAAAPLAGQQQGRVPAVVERARLDPSAGVNFHALVEPDTVYVGQQATYQVGVFLDDDVRARLRRNPEFIPPEMRAMLAYELPTGHAFVPRPGGRGGRYEVHVFERALFPLSPGTLDIPSATLNYSLPLSTSFFSREESHSARSQPLRIVALEPPEPGRPADFQGAVGTLGISARVDQRGARVGDPLVVTLLVSGRGNVNLFPRPNLDVPWGVAVATDERVRLDSASYLVSGTKEFDWIVTPRESGDVELPAVSYSFFDPYAERYTVTSTRPRTLTIAPGILAAADSVDADSAALTVRRIYGGEVGPAPVDRPWYWLAIMLLPLPAGLVAVSRRPARLRPTRSAADALVAAASPSGDPRRIRHAFANAVAARVGHNLPLPLVRTGAVTRLLRHEGVSSEVAAAAESLLAELDSGAYAGAGDIAPDVGERAVAIYGMIDAEARRSRRTPTRRLALFVLATAAGTLTATAHADAGRDAASLFDRGVAEYESRNFAEASELFAAAAQRAPRAPDAWANHGTAAWAVSDTARAVHGWQRALRLEPMATDIRPRLSLAPVSERSDRASVPALPVAALQWAALVLWAGACMLALVHAARRSRMLVPRVIGASVAAVCIAALAAWADGRLEARDLSVVAAPGPMRGAPAFGSEPRVSLSTGEITRVTGRHGAWSRIVVDGNRSGWVESERLLSLSRE